MNRLRDIKRAARLRLHDGMATPALYIPPSQGATPVPCTVRVHTKFAALGDRFDGAERAEAEPQIIFLASEVPAPKPQGIVSVEPGEAYRVVSADPADDITVTAKVTRVPAAQAAGLPLPEAYSQAGTPTFPSTVQFGGGGFGTIDYSDLDDGTDLILPANQWVRLTRNLAPSAANFNLPRGPWKDFAFYSDGLLRARAKGDFYLYKFSYVVVPSGRGSTVRFAVRPNGDPNFEFGPSAAAIDDNAGSLFSNSTTFSQQARSRFVAAGAEIHVMLTTDGVLRRFSPEVTPISFAGGV